MVTIKLAKHQHDSIVIVVMLACVLLPGVLMDALYGRGTRGHPIHQSRVLVGENGLARDPVGVYVQPCSAQPIAASLVRQRAAVACGPREGPHT